jgi:hypothetical protein
MQMSCKIPDFVKKSEHPYKIPRDAFVCQQMEIDVGAQLSLAAFATQILMTEEMFIIDLLESTADIRIPKWIERGAELRPLFMCGKLISFTISKRL